MRRLLRTGAGALLGRLGPRPQGPIGDTALGRVVVFRFGAIGDVVATTALLATLRREYPDASIAMVTSPPCEAILTGHPAIDHLLVEPEITAGPRFAGLAGARRRMRALSRAPWDAAFLTHGDVYRLLPALGLRARWKIGFDYGGPGGALGLTHAVPVSNRRDRRHRPSARPTLAETMVDLQRALVGRDLLAAPARIDLTPAERAAGLARLSDLGVRDRFVAIAPGATLAVKRWPPAAFGELAGRLDRQGVAVLLVGGAADRAAADAVRAVAPRAVSLVGALPLRESLAVLAAADVVVGADTGLIHAAAALERPTVALFGPTDPHVYGQTGPAHLVLTADMECRPCDSAVCRIAPGAPVPPCLEGVSVAAAAAAVDASLARAGSVGPG